MPGHTTRARARIRGHRRRCTTSSPIRSTRASPTPIAMTTCHPGSRGATVARATASPHAAVPSRASSGSPSPCRRWSTWTLGRRRRRSSRATPCSRSGTTASTTTFCAACSPAGPAVSPCSAAPTGQRQAGRNGGSICAMARIASWPHVKACPSRSVKAEELEAAVWDHVVGLLSDPQRLLAQFEHLAVTAEAGTLHGSAADQQLQARLERTARADKRLLDAYQAGAISLDELSERRSCLAEERRSLVHQQQERDRLRQKGMQVAAIRSNLAAFCGRIGTRLHEATFADKQAILQLVIDRKSTRL